MWPGVRAFLGRGDADQCQQFHRPHPCCRPGHAFLVDQGLGNLVADADHRVKAGHRVLEDEPDLGPPDVAQLLCRERQQIPPAEPHFAPGRADAVRQQAHQRQHCQGLAATAFAHDPQTFALHHRQVDPVHHPRRAGVAGDVDGQSLDVEKGHFCPFGLSASFRPSPRKLNATVTTASTAAGAARRCG